MEKTCSKCGKIKPLSAFYKDRSRKDGHAGQCKECACARSREWYEANKERAAARNKAWYAANRDRAAATSKAWREANPDRVVAIQRAWYEKNKERVAVTRRAWKKANPDRAAAIQKEWREANPDRVAAIQKEWREANPDRAAAIKLQYRYGVSLADYNAMLETQDDSCAICGRTAEEEGQRLAVDHDHDTDEVRGLLCGNCNRAIGLFQHDPKLLRGATIYLERWIKVAAAAE